MNDIDYVSLAKALTDRGAKDLTALDDAFNLIREIEDKDFSKAHELVVPVRRNAALLTKEQGQTGAIELYNKTLLFDAKHNLDCYLRYLESNRPMKEQFYIPRRRIMKQLVDALQDLDDGQLDELFLSMPPRVGKLLSNSTPVLTTEGWKNHGDLKIGDKVFNPEGKAVEVYAIHPKHNTTHTVTFSDGTQIKCHANHEWVVYDRRFGKERLLETYEMIGHIHNGGSEHKRGHRYNFQLPLKQPIEGTEKELHVKPYTLGAWLGDGSNREPRISSPLEDICISKRIFEDGYEKRNVCMHKETFVYAIYIGGLREALNKYGMCDWRKATDKYIPEEYLTASLQQRLDLLAGLLDTDGSLDKKHHRYCFSTTSEKIRDGIVELISTFGWRTTVCEYEPKVSSSGICGRKTVYQIAFNPTFEIPCQVERKQLKEFSKQRKIAITSIEESEPEEGNCITVVGGTYLAGNRMIPTHNTSILMFFVTWILGKYPEKSNLYSAFSDIITNAFYNGVLEVINDPVTYRWHEVFTSQKIVRTNSKDETIDVDRAKRYPTLTCRSLYGTLNGACDCNGYEISDDLIGGIEEALNKDRMISAWTKVDNNLLPRAKESAKILWCGTRWSLIDPAGLRMDLLRNDERFKDRRFKIINLPALDEHDESNFNYLYGVGFSTDYYHQRRASFERNNDTASWNAQYQGVPVERDGALFSPNDMRFYNGVLPEDSKLARIFMAVDPAFGGGDFTASPVCYQYEDGSVYVADVVYSDGDKKITQPLIADAIVRHGVNAIQFEANKSTVSYKEEVEALLKKKGIRINMTTKPAPNNVAKETRIYDKAPEIREMYFLEDGKRSRDYSLFMQNVFSFTMTGKNKHDDAVDSLAMAVEMIIHSHNRAELFKRPY